jgi:hypothetical protein
VSALIPLATMEALHPAGVAWAPRTTMAQVAWGFGAAVTLDSMTGQTIGLMGRMPLVAHAGVVGEQARRLLEGAGLGWPTTVRSYRTEAEAQAAVRALVAEGWKIAAPFPLPAGWVPEAARLVPSALEAALNDKARLLDWAPPWLAPERVVVGLGALDDVERALPGAPVVLKVCTDLGSGGGRDVVFCPGERSPGLAKLLAKGAPLHAVVVERLERFERLWCGGLAVLDAEVRWLGAARHVRGEDGLQVGSEVGPTDELPGWLIAELVSVGERARAAGYRGLAGCDVGLTEDGRFLLFDLNFRLNASTTLLLLRAAASARGGVGWVASWSASTALPAGQVVDRLLPWVREGRFVPLRLFDLAALPAPQELRTVLGLVLGEDAAGCAALGARVSAALG